MFLARSSKSLSKLITSNTLNHKSHLAFSTMDNLKRIGTHDGVFHCDEVLGCYMLKLLSPDAEIIRSRKEELLETCDIVIDVGGKYNLEQKRFDHHQREFNHSASTVLAGKPWTIKLSSAGLVYCHYGKLILKSILGDINDELTETLFDKVYEGFIQEIDAIDNGIHTSDALERYHISTHLSARVKELNPEWYEQNTNSDELFKKAMLLVGGEFRRKVEHAYKNWWPARGIVSTAISNRNKIDASGEIIELEQFCPWTTHLFALEKELKLEGTLKYVIFPGSQARNVWRVQSVPINETSFKLRHGLKESWRGLRDDNLSKISEIEGCIFVHSSGFIGGNLTREGAIEMAKKSLIV